MDKVSLASRACVVSQFSLVSLSGIDSLGGLVILVCLALLVSVVCLTILVTLAPGFCSNFTILSDIFLFCRIGRIGRTGGVSQL